MARYENLSVGQLQVDNIVNGTFSAWPFPHRKLFVDPGGILSDYGMDDVYLTLTAAEEAAVANQHDTVYIVSGSTSLSLTAELAWDKSYTHLIGCCAPSTIANRARIFNSGEEIANLLNISASGCVFQNFYIFQGGSAATALGNTTISGGRNYFDGVHFAGMGHVTASAETGAFSLKLDGAEENKFANCTVGVDTAVRSGANSQVILDSDAHRNEFVDCKFLSASSVTTAVMVNLADTSAALRYNYFKRCLFANWSLDHAAGGKLAACFKTPSSVKTNDLIIQDSMLVNITEWQASDRGNIWVLGSVGTAGTAGVGSSGQSIEPS